ncbi:hypothetical protein [Carnobacterium mobile]|uniref:hypothetical protein n=1 Tax=Carnobacterium mobile TaxID=2750 RepID=UPI000A5AB43F|nr:hypothetical protein [Carnobacterium mobile]
MKIWIEALIFGLIMSLFQILRGKGINEVFFTFVGSFLGAFIYLYIYRDNKNRKKEN